RPRLLLPHPGHGVPRVARAPAVSAQPGDADRGHQGGSGGILPEAGAGVQGPMTEAGFGSTTLVGFTEVGPRDGFQNWPDPVPTEIKLALIRAALAAGIPRVEVTAMVSPKWVPRMADAEDVLETLRAELSDGDMGSRGRV